jgi:hypothetical protein
MSVHHHVETKLGVVRFYLNPEYKFATQQMWIIWINRKPNYWFFHRNYTCAEIAQEIKRLIETNQL